MDPDIIAQLEEQLSLLTETIAAQNTAMAGQTSQTRNATAARTQENNEIRQGVAQRKQQSQEESRYAQIKAENDRRLDEAHRQLIQGLNTGVGALKSFAEALMDGNGKFGNYNKGISQLGDAALLAGAALSPLGAAIGGAIKAVTTLTQFYTKQADDLLVFGDGLAKLGAVNVNTSQELAAMANKAGVTTYELDKLLKPAQQLGGQFRLLGENSKKATENYMQLVTLTEQQRNQYRSLGITDIEQMAEAQTTFVSVMNAAGMGIQSFSKQQGGLAKAGLDYYKSLVVLNEYTGKTIEEQKKNAEAAAINTTFQVWQRKQLVEAQRLEDSGNAEKAAQIREKVTSALTFAAALPDEINRRGFYQELLYGQRTDNESITTGYLSGSGQATSGAAAQIRSGKALSQEDMLRRMNQIDQGAMKAIDTYGEALPFFDTIAFGAGAAERLANASKNINTDRLGAALAQNKSIGDVTAGQEVDPLKNNRNKLAETEITLKTKLNEIMTATNPLLGTFNVALIAAAAALGGLAAVSGVKAAGGLASRILGGAGAAATGARTGGMLAGAGGALARFAGPLGLLYSAGTLGYGGYKGWNADPNASFSGKLGNAASAGLNTFSWGLLGKSAEEISAGAAEAQKLQQATAKQKTAQGTYSKQTNTDASSIEEFFEKFYEKNKDLINEQDAALKSMTSSSVKLLKSTDQLSSGFEAIYDALDKMHENLTGLTIEQQRELDELRKRFGADAGNDDGSSSAAAVPGTASQAMDFFQSQGWSKAQSAGIVGNLIAESGLDPNAIRKNDAGPGKHSRGIAQWNRGRFENLLKFAEKKGTHWSDFQTQLEFVQHELENNGSGHKVYQMLKAIDDPATAAALIDQKYEISDGSAREKRIALAKQLMGGLAGGGSLRDLVKAGALKLNGGVTGNMRNLENIHPALQQRLAGAISEYYQKTGEAVVLTSGFRFPGDQDRISSGNNPKAKAGRSRHEHGLAVDLNSSDVAKLNRMGLLAKYGLIGGKASSSRGGYIHDAPHIELPKAERGGILTGPNSGYLAELHGTEMVVPLDNNFTRTGLKDKVIERTDKSRMIERIIEQQEMMKDNTATMMAPIQLLNATFNNNVKAMLRNHEDMITSLNDKLEEMIDKLDEGNSTRTKILQQSRV